MSKFKKAYNIDALASKVKDDLMSTPSYLASQTAKGVANSKSSEPMPDFLQSPAEKVLENGTNASIVIGKDRPASILSGYGGRGDTGTGTIDIVAGRMSHKPSEVDNNGKPLRANPDFKMDASRLYISQKTDIDDNLDLVAGTIGMSKAKSGIGIKSDAVRIVAREGIKLVTGTDNKGSSGEDLYSILGIDLIAGNDDSNLQPLVLGDNLNESIIKLGEHVDKLAGIVSTAITYQMKFNAKIATHTHISPFFGSPTTPSTTLVSAGIQVATDHGTKTLKDLVKIRTNIKFHKQTYHVVTGKKYINSAFNNVN